MYLKALELINFRNYSSEKLIPGEGINLIYGENGQGKTNLLESVYYLFSSISHRTKKEKNLIKWDESFLNVKGEVYLNNYGYKKLQIVYEPSSKKSIKINENITSVDRYFSQFPVVILYPQDLYLVTEGPALRRRFLNTEITRIYPAYYHHLLNYYRVLRQRNNILKNKQKREDLSSWDTLLVSHGSKIIRYRLDYLKKISVFATKFQKEFTAGKEDIKLSYKSRLNLKDLLNSDNYEGIENRLMKVFSESLERKREDEYYRGYTVTGPHVDDITILLNNRDIKKYASQGQQRTSVISLKFAQADLLSEEKHEEPLLLMDDCFSELDEVRSNHILELINYKKLQCFITSYEKFRIPLNYNVSFFKIAKGIVKDG